MREDVKIVYVDSMDDVEVLGDEGEAALFGLVEENEGYVFTDVANDDVLESLESGDKLLILPQDNTSDARVFYVDTVEETVVLFADGEEGTGVEVTASQEGSDLGDFFDYIRVNVEVEADTDDIDTSDADEDVVFLDEPVVYEPEDEDLEADLDDFSIHKSDRRGLRVGKGKVSVTARNRKRKS